MFQWEVKQTGLLSRYVSLRSENSQIKPKPLFPLLEALESVLRWTLWACLGWSAWQWYGMQRARKQQGVEDPVTLVVLMTPPPLPGVHALSSRVWASPITSFNQKDAMEAVLCRVQAPVLGRPGGFCFGIPCFIRASTTLRPACCEEPNLATCWDHEEEYPGPSQQLQRQLVNRSEGSHLGSQPHARVQSPSWPHLEQRRAVLPSTAHTAESWAKGQNGGCSKPLHLGAVLFLVPKSNDF